MRLSSNRHTGNFSIHHRGGPSWLPFFNVSSTYNHHREIVVDSLSQKLFGQLFLHSISGLSWPVNPDLHCRSSFFRLEKRRPTLSIRLSGLEKPRPTLSIRLSGLEKPRPTLSIRLSGLEKPRPTLSIRLSGLEKCRPTLSIRLFGLEKPRPTLSIRHFRLEKPRPTLSMGRGF